VKAGLFGQGDELVWRDETALWMLPASESLEAAQEASAKFNQRLEKWNDLVVFEGSAQIVCVIGSHANDDTTAL
jgi:hypothetical protein